MRICLLLFGIIFSWFPTAAQELTFEHYTVRDGLIQQQVNCLYRDRQGYLWIGTKMGISRFDGLTFTNFSLETLSSNPSIRLIIGRNDDKIYAFTKDKIFVIQENSIVEEINMGINDAEAVVYSYNRNDSIFLLTIQENNVIKEYYLLDSSFKLLNSYNFNLPHRYLLINGKFLHNPTTGTLYLSIDKEGLYFIKNNRIRILKELKNSKLSILPFNNNELLYIIDDNFYKIKDDVLVSLPDLPRIIDPKYSQIVQFAADKNGNYFYATNEPPVKLRMILNGVKIESSDNIDMINTIYIDYENILWVGTEYGFYKNTSRAILNYEFGKSGLNRFIWSVVESPKWGILFISFPDGPQMYNNNRFVAVPPFEGSNTLLKKEYDFNPGPSVLPSGSIFIPTNKKGGMLLEGNKVHFIDKDWAYAGMYSYVDQNRLFVGTYKGVREIAPGKIKYHQTLHARGKSSYIVSITKDKLGRYWLGSFSDVWILDTRDSVRLLPTPEVPCKLNGGNALLTDFRKNIWVGNLSGLFFFDYKKFQPIKHPIIKGPIMALKDAEDSLLFIGSLQQLMIIDLQAFYQNNQISVRILNKGDGFVGIEPAQNGLYADTKGYIWAVCSDRVVRIDPRMLRKYPQKPVVKFKGIYVLDANMKWLAKSHENKDYPLVFYHSRGERNLKFSVQGIDMFDPSGLRYSFYLQNFDRNWSMPVAEPEAVYTNLPAGKYTLFYRTISSGGAVSEEQRLEFKVVPVFYKSWWFLSGSGVSLAFLFLYAGGRINAVRRRKRDEKIDTERKILYLRMLSLKRLLSPHFTFNVLNTISASISKKEYDVAYQYLIIFSRLIRQVIDNENKLAITLFDELKFTEDYIKLILYRFQKKFTYTIEFLDDIDQSIKIPIMTIQLFVENAIKHGLLPKDTMGHLKISLDKNSFGIMIVIEDNGVGREVFGSNKCKSTGKGLVILQGFFDYFNSMNENKIRYHIHDLVDDKGKAAGTRVVIEIPHTFKCEFKHSEV